MMRIIHTAGYAIAGGFAGTFCYVFSLWGKPGAVDAVGMLAAMGGFALIGGLVGYFRKH